MCPHTCRTYVCHYTAMFRDVCVSSYSYVSLHVRDPTTAPLPLIWCRRSLAGAATRSLYVSSYSYLYVSSYHRHDTTYLCPHTTTYLFISIGPHTCMCPDTAVICVLILQCMRPSTNVYMCPRTPVQRARERSCMPCRAAMCVLILLYMCPLLSSY
jgi:hypothetical protein